MGNERHQFTTTDTDNHSARLLYVTFSKYEKDWSSIKHSHHFSEFFYVKSGKGQFVIDDETISIEKDDLVMVNPNVLHTEISWNAEPLEYVILGVEGIVFSFPEKKEYTVFHCQNRKQNLMFYFSSLLEEITEKLPDYELVCQNLLEVLIIQLSRYNSFSYDIVPTRSLNRECSKVKHYIDAHYAEDLSLDTLAELAHLNKYYFVHSFTSAFGISPISYLQEKRIQAGCELLTTTDHSIGEIARLTGFSSQSYFSQCFFKYCGMSAGKYRKMKQNAAPGNK